MLTTPIIMPARTTPRETARDVDLIPMFRKDAARVPVQAPVPVIYFFARKVLVWGCDKKYIGKFFTYCLEKGERGGQKLKARAGRNGLFIALLLFVGIPLPGTGAWTGTLAASFLNMGIKSTSLAVSLGVVLAGIIMGAVSMTGVHVFGL